MKALNKLTTFGILNANGDRWTAEANRVKLRRGRLVFLVGVGRIVAVANEGTWVNVADLGEGVTLDEVGANE